MANLTYKMRAEGDPKGKEYVYFCAHPKDFERYFESICADIFKTQNCAIWYSSDFKPWDEEARDSMAEGKMRVFVVPVTTAFLYQDNLAREQEIPFALSNHIAVLPIVMEKGLEEGYQKVFGDLQYLDKATFDPTAIPYEEKLKNYLSSVLLGDELAEKVRAAFEAYIFLSYRKKDRKYARELMQLIHANDFCRDVAIWYDEYLVPGENFKDSIGKALEKSDLFALLVTPSLNEKGNFVMLHEYPDAKKSGKPILPAEMEQTDKEALQEYYEGISSPVDARNVTNLKDALKERLANIAKAENDDPRHLFFIGLAYLNGIDVEADAARGVALITRAAEGGLKEAMQKLADMYRDGDKVERDFEKSLDWLNSYGIICEKDYGEKQDDASATEYFNALLAIGNFSWELGKIQDAKEIFSYMLDFSHEWNLKMDGSDNSCRALLASYASMGELCQEEGNMADARSYFEKGVRFAFFVSETGTIQDRWNLSFFYGKMGDIRKAEGDMASARSWVEKSLEIGEQLAKTGRVQDRGRLSVSYQRMGDICQAEGDMAGARLYFEKSLAIRKQLASETGTVEERSDLLVSYERMGNICVAEGDVAGARSYFEKGLAIAEQLAKETGTVDARRNLSVSYGKMGDICQAEGDMASARSYFEKDLEIVEQLASETGTVEARRDLSISYQRMGDICQEEGDIVGARSYYEKALEISEQLASVTGTIEAKRNLSVSYNNMGDICRAEGDIAGARSYFEKGLAIWEQLVKETGTVEARRGLSISYGRMGNICREEGDMAGARSYFEKYMALSEQLASETGTVQAKRDLLVSYGKMGDICQAEGDMASARSYYEKLLAISEQLASETGTIGAKRDLSVSYNKMGNICREEGDMAGAQTYFEKGFTIVFMLAQKTGTRQSLVDVKNFCADLFNLFRSQNKKEEATPYFRLYQQISEKLGEE